MTDFDQDITSAQMDALQDTERMRTFDTGYVPGRYDSGSTGYITFAEAAVLRSVSLRRWPAEVIGFLNRVLDEAEAAAQEVGGAFAGAAERRDRVRRNQEPGRSTGYGDSRQGTVTLTPHLQQIMRDHRCEGCSGRRSSRGFYTDPSDQPFPEWLFEQPQWNDRAAGGTGHRCTQVSPFGRRCELSLYHNLDDDITARKHRAMIREAGYTSGATW